MGDLLITMRTIFFASLLFAAPLAAQRTHPTQENLSLAVTATVSRSDTLSGDTLIDRMAARLRTLRPTGRIGGEAGAGGADFGRIADVTVDRTGRILVLDDQDKSITRWTAQGRPAGRFGRAGGGPLEFQYPARLAVQDDGTLLVVDRAVGIKRFRWDTSATLRDTWSPGRGGEAICAHGAEVTMVGLEGEGTLTQVFNAHGIRTRGIGAPYQDPAPFTRRLLSSGNVGCLPDGRIVTTMHILPFVRFWSATGAPEMTTSSRDFHPMGVEETGRGLTYSMPSTGYHAIRALTPLGRDLLLVQIFFKDGESTREQAEYRELQTYLISTRTGRGVFIGTSLPLILPLPDGGFVGWRNDPVPEVVFLR
jgi:hypothetical protein